MASVDTNAGMRSPEGAPVPADLVLADVPSRLVAYVIDAVLLTVLVFVAAVIVSAILGPTVRFGEAEDVIRGRVSMDRGLAIVDGLVSALVGGLYFIGSWTYLRGSPGMRLLGLRIGRERDGGRVGLAPSFVRWLLLGAPLGLATLLTLGTTGLQVSIQAAALAWYLILLVTTVRSDTRQGLHDHYARTVVTKMARRPSWAARG